MTFIYRFSGNWKDGELPFDTLDAALAASIDDRNQCDDALDCYIDQQILQDDKVVMTWQDIARAADEQSESGAS